MSRPLIDQQSVDDEAAVSADAVRFLFYHSDADQDMMFHFEDVNRHWAAVQLVLITSKVTVGADCQVRFDQVFADLRGSGGCMPRTLFQMVMRFRRVRVKDVYACLDITTVRPDVGHAEFRDAVYARSACVRQVAAAAYRHS